jgi:hypothetical protein
LGETVDERNHFVAARNRKRAAGAEIVLNVDHKENVALPGCHAAHRVTRLHQGIVPKTTIPLIQPRYRVALPICNC